MHDPIPLLRAIFIAAIAFNLFWLGDDALRTLSGFSFYELLPEPVMRLLSTLQSVIYLLMNLFLLLLLPRLQLKPAD